MKLGELLSRLDIRSLRAHRDYRLFFWGQFVSLIGSWMQMVAQSLLVYELTGSKLTLGVVAFCANVPVLVLAPAAGWVADRYPRRTVVIVTHVLSMVQAVVLAVLTLSGEIRVEHVYALAVLFGISNCFEMPARHSLVGDMVGRDDLPNAIALNSSMINSTRIVGPALGGWVVLTLGEGLCFTINAASFLAALGTLLMIHPFVAPAPEKRDSPLRQTLDGFAYVRSKRPVLVLLGLLMVASFVNMPYMTLLPAFAERLGNLPDALWTPGDELAMGLLHSMAGVGALAGALSLAARRGSAGLESVLTHSMLVAGVSVTLFAIAPSLPLALALAVPAGWGLMRHLAATNTMLQSIVPDRIRGRVMSFYSWMLVGMAPFAGLAGGALGDRIGEQATVALFGVAGILSALVVRAVLPTIRDETQAMLQER